MIKITSSSSFQVSLTPKPILNQSPLQAQELTKLDSLILETTQAHYSSKVSQTAQFVQSSLKFMAPNKNFGLKLYIEYYSVES